MHYLHEHQRQETTMNSWKLKLDPKHKFQQASKSEEQQGAFKGSLFETTKACMHVTQLEKSYKREAPEQPMETCLDFRCKLAKQVSDAR